MALRGEKTMLMEVKELHRSEKSIVTLVIDPDTGIRYVRKELKSSHPVYQQLQGTRNPAIRSGTGSPQEGRNQRQGSGLPG